MQTRIAIRRLYRLRIRKNAGVCEVHKLKQNFRFTHMQAAFSRVVLAPPALARSFTLGASKKKHRVPHWFVAFRALIFLTLKGAREPEGTEI
jgi:hypothetical protein